MKVRILVAFDVEVRPGSDSDEVTPVNDRVAKSAARIAAYAHLNLSDRAPYECFVHVDGHGEYVVKMG